MNKVERYLSEYNESHLNKTNVLIHKICVPLIFFSIVGLVLSLERYLDLSYLTLGGMFLAMMYYFILSRKYFIYMLPVFFVSYLLNMAIAVKLDILYVSLALFSVSWVFQFIGHKIEGKKPSFLKDLQFLLVGPLWTINKVFVKSTETKS
jgi:uncharacterized membrane protein YGL010W